MAVTLSFGYKRPETGDRGNVFFPILEDNIDLVVAHDHDGTNSFKIVSASVLATTQAIPSGSWAAVAGQLGTFKQLVTMPVGLSYDQHNISFKLTTLGHQVYLTVEKVSAGSYDVYINDASLDVTAVYD